MNGTPLRPAFREALALLATATQRLVAKGFSPPILVGGAAVEIYTGGAVTSGDFDFVSPWRDEFFAELKALGFEQPKTAGGTVTLIVTAFSYWTWIAMGR